MSAILASAPGGFRDDAEPHSRPARNNRSKLGPFNITKERNRIRAKAYEFQSKFRDSEKYTHLVIAYLRTSGLVVEDKTSDDDMDYQKRGVDFLVNGKAVEFKHDDRLHETGNVAFEIVANLGKGTPGACLYSKAKWLIYLDTVNLHCHLFSLPELREAVASCDIPKFQACIGRTRDEAGRILYCSVCLLLPLEFCKTHTTYAFSDLSSFGKETL